MNVVKSARYDGDSYPAALRDTECDTRGTCFQGNKLRLDVTHAFGKHAHAATRLDNLIESLESLRIVGIITMLGARVNRHRPRGIEQSAQYSILPKLGVCHEVNRPAPTLGRQQPPVHERIGMIPGKDNRPIRGNVLQPDHIDASKKRTGYEPYQRLYEALHHCRPLCDHDAIAVK